MDPGAQQLRGDAQLNTPEERSSCFREPNSQGNGVTPKTTMHSEKSRYDSTSKCNKIAFEKLHLLEARPRHRYIFCRPRLFQYTYQSQVMRVAEEDSARELKGILPIANNAEPEALKHDA